MEIIFLLIAAIALALFLYNCKNSKKPLKYSIICMVSGVILLSAVAFFGNFFGTLIVVNYVTCFIALTAGVPGVIMLILFNLFN